MRSEVHPGCFPGFRLSTTGGRDCKEMAQGNMLRSQFLAQLKVLSVGLSRFACICTLPVSCAQRIPSSAACKEVWQQL